MVTTELGLKRISELSFISTLDDQDTFIVNDANTTAKLVSFAQLKNSLKQTNFLVSSNAPTLQNIGDAWLNPQTKELRYWDGSTWVILIKDYTRYRLEEASNVQTGTPANNSILTYNTANNRWEFNSSQPMLRSVYDTDNTGIVDNSERLGGNLPSYYLNLTNTTGTLSIAKGGTGANSAASALTTLGAAPVNSPNFTGSPSAPTPALNNNNQQLATTAFVRSRENLHKDELHSGVVAVNNTARTLVRGQLNDALFENVLSDPTNSLNNSIWTCPKTGFYLVAGTVVLNFEGTDLESVYTRISVIVNNNSDRSIVSDNSLAVTARPEIGFVSSFLTPLSLNQGDTVKVAFLPQVGVAGAGTITVTQVMDETTSRSRLTIYPLTLS